MPEHTKRNALSCARSKQEGRTPLGFAIEEGLREALAWKRGEVELEVAEIGPTPASDAIAIGAVDCPIGLRAWAVLPGSGSQP